MVTCSATFRSIPLSWPDGEMKPAFIGHGQAQHLEAFSQISCRILSSEYLESIYDAMCRPQQPRQPSYLAAPMSTLAIKSCHTRPCRWGMVWLLLAWLELADTLHMPCRSLYGSLWLVH
jgi:hypothetical protein